MEKTTYSQVITRSLEEATYQVKVRCPGVFNGHLVDLNEQNTMTKIYQKWSYITMIYHKDIYIYDIFYIYMIYIYYQNQAIHFNLRAWTPDPGMESSDEFEDVFICLGKGYPP